MVASLEQMLSSSLGKRVALVCSMNGRMRYSWLRKTDGLVLRASQREGVKEGEKTATTKLG